MISGLPHKTSVLTMKILLVANFLVILLMTRMKHPTNWVPFPLDLKLLNVNLLREDTLPVIIRQ